MMPINYYYLFINIRSFLIINCSFSLFLLSSLLKVFTIILLFFCAVSCDLTFYYNPCIRWLWQVHSFSPLIPYTQNSFNRFPKPFYCNLMLHIFSILFTRQLLFMFSIYTLFDQFHTLTSQLMQIICTTLYNTFLLIGPHIFNTHF